MRSASLNVVINQPSGPGPHVLWYCRMEDKWVKSIRGVNSVYLYLYMITMCNRILVTLWYHPAIVLYACIYNKLGQYMHAWIISLSKSQLQNCKGFTELVAIFFFFTKWISPKKTFKKILWKKGLFSRKVFLPFYFHIILLLAITTRLKK